MNFEIRYDHDRNLYEVIGINEKHEIFSMGRFSHQFEAQNRMLIYSEQQRKKEWNERMEKIRQENGFQKGSEVQKTQKEIEKEIQKTLAEIPLDEEELERLFGKKYYYKTNGQKLFPDCVEDCAVIGSGVKIGSGICQECEYCVADSSKEKWVICKKIKEATAKKQTI